MSKRRRKDLSAKIFQGNSSESSYNNDDYTADYESYDFERTVGTTENEDNHQNCYENGKQENSSFYEDQNSDNLCRDFVRNVCRRGSACKFKHSTSPQTTRSTKIDTKNNMNQFEVNFCHDYQNSGCSRPQCRFIHCNRPEQEFYYATGILLSSVPFNNLQMPICKDFINGACSRIKCKYLHMNKEEIDHQSSLQEIKPNHLGYNHGSAVEQTNIHTNGNFFQSANSAYYPSAQQMSVIPSHTISLGNNNLPLTNTQFTVSLPLGSVSYATSQPQLISQPSLTNVQYIHDSVSLPQHHTIQPQFTLISSENHHSHSQMISAAPLPIGSSIINPVAMAHSNPNQSQQYTISQQPPVGVSIFSVATPCSIISAAPTTIHQQLRPYDQKEQACMLQNNIKTTGGNIEYTLKDNGHLSSTLTPIYIQHSLPSAVPLTQYRVTALESAAAPGIVIHNPMDRSNVTYLHANNSNMENATNFDGSSESYTKMAEENESLRKRLSDLEKQTSDLQTANELLLDQNARLRNWKSCCNGSGGCANTDTQNDPDNLLVCSSSGSQRCTNGPSNSCSDVISNSMSEMATITLTVPIGRPHNVSSFDHQHHHPGTVLSAVPSASDSDLGVTTSTSQSSFYSVASCSNLATNQQKVMATSVCSSHISPTLVSTALRSIQKSVMPRLNALMASSSSMDNRESLPKHNPQDGKSTAEYLPEGKCHIELPLRASSCPVTCSYPTPPEPTIRCHQTIIASKAGTLRQADFRHTPQLCFQ